MKVLSHSLIEKIPLPAYVTGSIISIISFIGYLAVSEHSGLLAQILNGEVGSTGFRATLTLMVLIGYLPIAHWYLRRWHAFHIGELNEGFGLADERRVPEEKILIPLGLFGLASFIGLFLVYPSPGDFVLQLSKGTLDFTVLFIVMSLVGWWMGRFSYELVWCAIQMAKMAKRLPAVDLLETGAYRPFTQHGVHSILLIVIMMSITMHLVAAPGSGLIGAIVNSVTMLVLAIIALLLPMRGMHLRIREQKQLELDVLRRHIQEERGQLLEKTNSTSDRLVGLLAMESRIERVYEWPFDVGSLSKVLLYLVLGLGSWVGAALVERLLETAL